jgi:hypothetical protein
VTNEELCRIVLALANEVKAVADNCCCANETSITYIVASLADSWEMAFPFPSVYPAQITDHNGTIWKYSGLDGKYFDDYANTVYWHKLLFPVRRYDATA